MQTLPDPCPFSIVTTIILDGNPSRFAWKHAALDLDVSFTERKLKGQATLTVEPGPSGASDSLVLDTRALK